MDQIDLKVLKIGARLQNNKVVGNPKFLMDFSVTPPSALIQINGAFEIPVLQTYASCNVLLDKNAASRSNQR